MSTSNVNRLSFKLLRSQVVVLVFVLFILGFLAYESYLPYLAERQYRDGFNMDAGRMYSEAEANFRQAVQLAPWDTQYKIELARLYCDMAAAEPDPAKKMDYLMKSEAVTTELIKADDQNPWHKNRMASIYGAMAEIDRIKSQYWLDRAEFYIKSASQDDSQNPLFQLNMAYFYHRMGRLEDAYSYYQKAIAFDPNLIEARYNMADIFLKKGDIQQALDQYVYVSKISPNFSSTNSLIGALSAMRYEQTHSVSYLNLSVEAFERSLVANPSDMIVMKNLANLYYKLQKWDKATVMYAQLLALYANQNEVYPSYVDALVKSGRAAAVLSEMKQRLSRNPYDEVASMHVKYLSALVH